MSSRFGSQYPVLGRSRDKQRFLFFAALGLAFSLLIALLVVVKLKVSSAKQDLPKVQETKPVETRSIATITLLAPERPVRAGTRLSDVKFKKMYWPRNQVPEGVIRDVAELRDKFAKDDLSPGVPLQLRHLSDKPSSSVLPLTPGNRAVTITIDAETAIEYHVLPGTRVDVVLTHFVNRSVKTQVLVQNARVLSLGGNTGPGSPGTSGRGGMKSQTVTLDVSPQDALRITASKQLGKLSLLMRSSADSNPSPSNEVNQNEITRAREDEKPKPEKQCSRGKVKIDGQTYNVDCSGALIRAGS